jgi:hypothetical protein
MRTKVYAASSIQELQILDALRRSGHCRGSPGVHERRRRWPRLAPRSGGYYSRPRGDEPGRGAVAHHRRRAQCRGIQLNVPADSASKPVAARAAHATTSHVAACLAQLEFATERRCIGHSRSLAATGMRVARRETLVHAPRGHPECNLSDRWTPGTTSGLFRSEKVALATALPPSTP